MSVQQTLIIVKPDGVAKGLVGRILRDLRANELQVTAHARVQLSREWVETLYDSERNEVYFTKVVEWVSSAPVLYGIRGLYSENWIKNIAHVPDSMQSAMRELELAEYVFERSAKMNEDRLNGKMVFALTGMSECGKSTVGEYLDSKGIRRLKIVKLFEKVRDKWSPNQELYKFLRQQEERDPYALWDAFIDELLTEMERIGTNAVSIESLYGGGLGPYLKQGLDHHFCIVFVDISLEIRLRRQMRRECLLSIEDAKKHLLPRDQVKERSGIPALKGIAGEIVDNSGTLEDLYRAIDAIVKKYLIR